MFDWLFGNSTKKQMDDTKSKLSSLQTNQQYSNEMGSAISDVLNNEANKGLVSKLSATNPNLMSRWNQQAQALRADANQSREDINGLQEKYNSLEKKNRHNYFGDGLLGSLLNAVAQTGTAIYDLATGNYKDRDVMSDLGAAGQTLLGALPVVGGAAKALNMGKVASGLGKINNALTTIPGSIGTGAVFGGLETLRQDGADTNLGDVLNSAGTGAAFGAALPMANNFIKNRGAKNLVTKYMSDPRYSQASEALQNAGREEIGNFVKRVAKSGSPGLQEIYGGLYKNALPQSTFGKLALGGGALYGGSQLLGGGQQQPQTIEDYYAMQQGGHY